MTIAIVLVPLLSGCLATLPKTCVADCAPVQPAAKLPASFRWESCQGFAGSFRAPLDAVRAAVPAAFELLDTQPGTAGVVVRGQRCDRATTDVSLHPEVAILAVMVRVRPIEAGWSQGTGTGLFTLDVLVSDEAAAHGLAALGVHAQAAVLKITKLLTLDATSADVWEFAGETLRIAAPVARGGAGLQSIHETEIWFDAAGGFRRVADTFAGTLQQPPTQVGPITIQGSARSARLFPTGSTAWEVQAVGAIDELWVGNDRAFLA